MKYCKLILTFFLICCHLSPLFTSAELLAECSERCGISLDNNNKDNQSQQFGSFQLFLAQCRKKMKSDINLDGCVQVNIT